MLKKLSILLLFVVLLSCSSKFKPESKIDKFYNYPNPFNSKKEHTTYKVVLRDVDVAEANVRIYSSDGTSIASFGLTVDENGDKKIALATWVGTDENGNYLPAYVYDAIVKVTDINGNIYTTSTKTVLR